MMAEGLDWRFYKFGLLVTGEGEEIFLPRIFRGLMSLGNCNFEVIRKIGQLSPRTSPKRRLELPGTNKVLPTRDQEIGLAARGWLDRGGDYVILVDDLEGDRVKQRREVFLRYRRALDGILGERRHLASVHFLVNMLEAYYFADVQAVNYALGTNIQDSPGDVEQIRHPKNDLKKLSPGFDEKVHGQKIVERLDIEHVLENPQTCASLRVLFAWCIQSLGRSMSERFQLEAGIYDLVTGPQLKHDSP